MFVQDGAGELREAWAELRRRHPRVGPREAAAVLAVSEGELLAAAIGDTATRLEPEWSRLLGDVAGLGALVCMTRNPRATARVRAGYGTVHVAGSAATVLHRALELRAHLDRWQSVIALDDGREQSLQVFDGDGTAVHKIYLDAGSDRTRFHALRSRWASGDQTPRFVLRPIVRRDVVTPDPQVDVAGLRSAWGVLRDTQEVGYLLKRFGVSRHQAFRTVAPDFSHRVSRRSVREVFHGVAASGCPVAVTVGNAGAVQTHAGTLRRVAVQGRTLVVRDYGFQLDVRLDRVAEAWVVRKPTLDGSVTSYELFDPAREPILTLTSARRPGFQESPAWRALLARLPMVTPVAA